MIYGMSCMGDSDMGYMGHLAWVIWAIVYELFSGIGWYGMSDMYREGYIT